MCALLCAQFIRYKENTLKLLFIFPKAHIYKLSFSFLVAAYSLDGVVYKEIFHRIILSTQDTNKYKYNLSAAHAKPWLSSARYVEFIPGIFVLFKCVTALS